MFLGNRIHCNLVDLIKKIIEFRSGVGSGSVIQRYGSEESDLEHTVFINEGI